MVVTMSDGFLTDKQRGELEAVLRRQSESHGVARRVNVILLLDDGWDYEQIASALYVKSGTVREWRKHFDNGGLDELSTFDWQGGQSRLSKAKEQELTTWLRENPCRITREIRAHISNKLSKNYSHSGCIKLMHRLCLEYVKPKRVPALADEQKQQELIDNYQQLQRYLPEGAAIYFGDVVHPEHQSRPAHGWFLKGEKVALKSSTGRKRINIHGAINLENFDFPFVESLTVDANSTIALLKKTDAANRAKSVIYVFLDNADCQTLGHPTTAQGTSQDDRLDVFDIFQATALRVTRGHRSAMGEAHQTAPRIKGTMPAPRLPA